MSESTNLRRQPDLHWKQLVQLKAAAICIRLYRNRLARWVRRVEVVKAIGSSGGIAGWVIWKDWPFVWTAIIAASQLLDATSMSFHSPANTKPQAICPWPLNYCVSTRKPNGKASIRAKYRTRVSPSARLGSQDCNWKQSINPSRRALSRAKS